MPNERTRAGGRAGSLIFALFVALVVVAPLPFGGARPWAWSMLAVWAGAVTVAWAALAAARADLPRVPISRFWWCALPYALVLGYVAWQTVPGISGDPVYAQIWDRAADALGTPLVRSVSLDAWATTEDLIRLLLYGAAFWLALQLGRDADRVQTALLIIVLAAALNAAYGISMQFTGARMVLWTDKTAYVDDVTGTFVNRNHFAPFCGLALIAAAALFTRRLRAKMEGAEGRNERMRVIGEMLDARGQLLLGAVVVLGAAVLLSHSRAGLAVTVGGLVTYFLALTCNRSAARTGFTGFAVAAGTVGVLLFLIAGGGVSSRLAVIDDEFGGRAIPFDVIFGIIGDAPWIGSGGGTFVDVYRIERPPGFTATMNAAHNTYLENALEYGIPIAALLALTVAAIAIRCFLGALTRRRNMEWPAMGLAAAVLVGLHSLVDFSLQIPGVTITAVTLLGLGMAQSWSSGGAAPARSNGDRPTDDGAIDDGTTGDGVTGGRRRRRRRSSRTRGDQAGRPAASSS